MQTARNYVTEASYHIGNALQRMPASAPLPQSINEISRYVEQLLSPKEQAMCDMATD